MSRWYKRDGAAFIQGTMGLTLEEKGAYSLVLDLIYSNGGPIADDPRWLSGVCGVSIRKWTSLRASLIQAGKLFAENGQLMNARAAREIEGLAPEIGSKSARNVAETSAKPAREVPENEVSSRENNDLSPLDKTREDKNRGEKKESPSLRSEPDGFKEFYTAYPRKTARPAAVKAFAKALKRATVPVLVQGAIRYAQERANEDQAFTKHPATWLNNDCWLDEAATHKPFGGRNGGRSQTQSPNQSFAADLIGSIQEDRRDSGIFEGGGEVIDITPTGPEARAHDKAA